MIEAHLHYRTGDFSFSVDFHQAAQTVMAVWGASGAGKTTLARLLCGFDHPATGHVTLNGKVLYDAAQKINIPPHKRSIGYVAQKPVLFPHLSCMDNLTYGLKRNPEGKVRDVNSIIKLLDLHNIMHRSPAHLSGGEAQRLALGRSLLHNPQYLIMDEPLSAIDSGRKNDILPYMERLIDNTRQTLLYISHAASEVAHLADQVLYLKNGQKIWLGNVTPNLQNPILYDSHLNVLTAIVHRHHTEHEVTELKLNGQSIWTPLLSQAIGTSVRICLNANDIILSRHTRQENISTNTILKATITHMTHRQDGYWIECHIDQTPVFAHVTKAASQRLAIETGQSIDLLIKSMRLSASAVSVP